MVAILPAAVEPPAPNPAPVYGNPRAEVERVDALDCRADAMHDIGGKRTCETHYYEVLHAYWESNSNLVLHHYTQPRGVCGDLVQGVWTS